MVCDVFLVHPSLFCSALVAFSIGMAVPSAESAEGSLAARLGIRDLEAFVGHCAGRDGFEELILANDFEF